jgi:hypothetical protein
LCRGKVPDCTCAAVPRQRDDRQQDRQVLNRSSAKHAGGSVPRFESTFFASSSL